MKKQKLKQKFKNQDYRNLLLHIGDFLPDEADFGILQISPEGSLKILKPIERPGFSASDLLSHIRKSQDALETWENLIGNLDKPILIELDREGHINKLSIPNS